MSGVVKTKLTRTSTQVREATRACFNVNTMCLTDLRCHFTGLNIEHQSRALGLDIELGKPIPRKEVFEWDAPSLRTFLVRGNPLCYVAFGPIRNQVLRVKKAPVSVGYNKLKSILKIMN